MEEGLKQMENVQDDVMKKMEQHVDQLTTTGSSTCDHIIMSSSCDHYSSSYTTITNTHSKNYTATTETNTQYKRLSVY